MVLFLIAAENEETFKRFISQVSFISFPPLDILNRFWVQYLR
jgi:hypothetical protein